MTGLDKIVEQIRRDAEEIAERNIQEGKEEAQRIRQEGEKNAQRKRRELKESAIRASEERMARLRSAADLLCRKRLLEEKQRLIQEVIQGAKESLYCLPKKEYFDLLLQLVKKYAWKQEVEIKFSPTDFQRMPGGFAQRVQQELPNGAVLRISPQTVEIDGGFVLVYGGVEENCSFQALFESSQELLQDEVQEKLFHSAL